MTRRPRRSVAQKTPVAPKRAASEASLPVNRRWLGAILIALFAIVLYIPGFSNGFVYDAQVAVEQDTRIHTLAHPLELLTSSYWAFDQERLALYRPLVTLSYAIDWAVHGGNPSGFHLTNALAHALTAALVFLLLASVTPTLAAFVGAALFAAHPLNTEAVASIVGRADIFAAGFSVAALLVWKQAPARSRTTLLVVPLLYLFALGSKESAIVLPGLLVILDVATGRLRRARVRDWLRERAAPLIAIGVVAIAYIAVRIAVLGVFAPTSLNPIMSVYSDQGTHVRTALQIWPDIVRLLIFPRVLLADYSPRVLIPVESWTPRAIGGLLILAGLLIGGVFALLKGRGRIGLALLWIPVVLFTVSNLVVPIGVLLAERTLYIAVFAVALAVALAIERIGGIHKWRMRSALTASAVICLLFSARTVARLPAWSTTEEVFRTLLRDRPDSFRAQWQAGFAARQRGDIPGAVRYYVAAITLWPFSRPLYIEAATMASQAQQPVAARVFAEKALEHFPDDPMFLRHLAVAAITMNDTTAARAAIQRGLRVRPDDELFNMMRDSIGR